jgi:hypothetical protein
VVGAIRIVFPVGSAEGVERLAGFLRRRLDPAFTLEVRGGEVIVANVDTRDRAWRTALWAKNNCGMFVRFVIEERDEGGNLVYLSTCRECRENVNMPHSRHITGG